MVRQLKLLGPVLGGVSLLVALSVGCVDYEEQEKYVPMTVEVDDWRDEIIYQLLTDRFANGDPRNDHRVDTSALARYQGGDYQGIIDRLDYIEALGVTALWISPIVKNVDHDAGFDAYHGYWALDFESLNPHFGDLGTLRRLVDEAHARGIKVILDIVTNHMGQIFYYDINSNGQPDEWLQGTGAKAWGGSDSQRRADLSRVTEYDPDYDPRGVQAFTSLGNSGPAAIRFFDMPDIFRVKPLPEIFQLPEVYNRRGRVTDWNQRDQVVLGDFPGGLKDIDTTILEVRETMVRVYSEWILKTNIDGLRIDTIKHVEDEFWQVFAPAVRKRLASHGKSNFLIFGEAFDGDDQLIGSYTRPNMLDSVFYFSQKFQVFDDVFVRGGATTAIARLFEQRRANYGADPQPDGIGVAPHDVLVNFMDNHDVPRVLFQTKDKGALRAGLSYLLTEDGIPCIYYGTEQEFSGGNDPANRERLWDSGYDTTNETFRHIARLTRLRKQYEALRRGSFEVRWATDHVGTEQDAGIIAFERKTSEGAYALVVINSRPDKESSTSTLAEGGSDMSVSAAPNAPLVDALSGEEFVVGPAGTLAIDVGPQALRVLVPAADYRPL